MPKVKCFAKLAAKTLTKTAKLSNVTMGSWALAVAMAAVVEVVALVTVKGSGSGMMPGMLTTTHHLRSPEQASQTFEQTALRKERGREYIYHFWKVLRKNGY